MRASAGALIVEGKAYRLREKSSVDRSAHPKLTLTCTLVDIPSSSLVGLEDLLESTFSKPVGQPHLIAVRRLQSDRSAHGPSVRTALPTIVANRDCRSARIAKEQFDPSVDGSAFAQPPSSHAANKEVHAGDDPFDRLMDHFAPTLLRNGETPVSVKTRSLLCYLGARLATRDARHDQSTREAQASKSHPNDAPRSCRLPH